MQESLDPKQTRPASSNSASHTSASGASATTATPSGSMPAEFSEDEAQEIYKRAAELQSQTLFQDEKLSQDTLERTAGRAGIDEKFVEAAIVERKAELARKEKDERATAERQVQLRKRGAIGAGTVVVLGSLIGLYGQSALSGAAGQVEAGQSQIENVQQRRHDLIPNLISVTKATMENDRARAKDLTEALSRANSEATSAASPEQKAAAEARLSEVVTTALAELRSGGSGNSEATSRLLDEMAGAENRISVERRRHNQAIERYNTTARSFPISLVRPLLGYPARYDYFKADKSAGEIPKF